jgi:hypothetical protein
MPKKIRTNVTSAPSVFQPLLVTPGTLDASLMPSQERSPQRYAAKQSFSVHQRVAPQRVTSFANRRRNK